jgi:hypothetical protein
MDQAVVVDSIRIIELEDTARYFHVILLAIIIVILMNLEKTFRSSSGIEKWRIKYMTFGVSCILLMHVYLLSHRLLYGAIDMRNIYILSAAILAGNILITYSILRAKIVDGDIYVSRKVIYSSISLIAIGLYTIIIALSAQVLKSLHIHKDLKLDVLLIFFAVLGMVIAFYKESFRRRAKAIINKNFRKSKYVHHDEWMVFSTELSRKINKEEICGSLLKALSDRLFVKCASLWLLDDLQKTFHMVDSRNVESQGVIVEIGFNNKVIEYLYQKNRPVSRSDILTDEALHPIGREISTWLDETGAEVVVPLILAQKWVGLLTLGKIQTGEPYDEIEDYDLLKSVAAHAASAINNARLFEEKMKAKELEAFHRLSSFLVHDLKNTTSMLSLVAQNANEHFHNPEFQKDALQTVSEVVGRMKKMIATLTELPTQLELKMSNLDLNALIRDAVEKLSPLVNGSEIEKHLEPIPPVRADAEELSKVVQNLLLNAHEAMAGNGHIQVATRANGDEVVFSVSDSGPGMAREFVKNALFRPFKSTKKKGLGIGLYHCKAIVEAHKGKIEVKSEPGCGSTFSVYLPLEQSAEGGAPGAPEGV